MLYFFLFGEHHLRLLPHWDWTLYWLFEQQSFLLSGKHLVVMIQRKKKKKIARMLIVMVKLAVIAQQCFMVAINAQVVRTRYC